MQQPVVEMIDISKSFPGVQALDKVSFALQTGEVHCLLGENGAGKSTLIKVLSGAYKMDSGSIKVNGDLVNIRNAFDARKLGISTIYQETSLVPALSASENLFLGEEETVGSFIVAKKKMLQRAKEVFERMHVDINPAIPVMDLNAAQQQMVEIARSLVNERKIIIMDEPTSAITDKDVAELFRLIRELKSNGVSIIYISHRLQELAQIVDRVTVMRDGKNIGTFNMDSVTTNELVSCMVGRELQAVEQCKSFATDEIVLDVENVGDGHHVHDASFHLRRGEILGFAGLVGAGRSELMRMIFGAQRMTTGKVSLHGEVVKISHPRKAVRLGVGYLSEDRKGLGLLLHMDIAKNISIASLKLVSHGVFIDKRLEAEAAHQSVDSLSIATNTIYKTVQDLSGGNQQKVIVAKWLMTNCDILIFDEPTKGIDVGARAEIYRLMRQLAKEGKSIIMVSSDMNEVITLSNRVIVMCEGNIVSELTCVGEDIQEDIMALMMGGFHNDS